jgi:TolB protein
MRVLLGLFAVSIAMASPSDVPNDWQLHTDSELHVAIRCPREWKPDRQGAYRDRTYLEGRDQQDSYLGYVQLLVSEGNSPAKVCRADATHKMQPYGTYPRIQSLKIQGRRACLVWPSKERLQSGPIAGVPQNAYQKNPDALLVVEYPRGTEIDGQYGQLVIIADKDHILRIGRTLRFLPTTEQSGAAKPGK